VQALACFTVSLSSTSARLRLTKKASSQPHISCSESSSELQRQEIGLDLDLLLSHFWSLDWLTRLFVSISCTVEIQSTTPTCVSLHI
jgi:hypothetical protein